MKKILGGLIAVVVLLVVIAKAFPILWPIAANTTDIDAMTGTDAGTTTFQALWPIVLLLVGLGVIVALVMVAVKRFGLGGGGMGMMLPIAFNDQFALYAGIVGLTALVVYFAIKFGKTRKFALFKS